MKDFRSTFNISYTTVTVKTNKTVSAQCTSEDDVETSALLVPNIVIVHVNCFCNGTIF